MLADGFRTLSLRLRPFSKLEAIKVEVRLARPPSPPSPSISARKPFTDHNPCLRKPPVKGRLPHRALLPRCFALATLLPTAKPQTLVRWPRLRTFGRVWSDDDAGSGNRGLQVQGRSVPPSTSPRSVVVELGPNPPGGVIEVPIKVRRGWSGEGRDTTEAQVRGGACGWGAEIPRPVSAGDSGGGVPECHLLHPCLLPKAAAASPSPLAASPLASSPQPPAAFPPPSQPPSPESSAAQVAAAAAKQLSSSTGNAREEKER